MNEIIYLSVVLITLIILIYIFAEEIATRDACLVVVVGSIIWPVTLMITFLVAINFIIKKINCSIHKN
jgi:RsiW-degrading membrane proteinase PrsW (M82 family)